MNDVTKVQWLRSYLAKFHKLCTSVLCVLFCCVLYIVR